MSGEHINETDLERHKRMIVLGAQARELANRAGKLAAAVEIWAEELHERYELAAADYVTPDGHIIRNSPAE